MTHALLTSAPSLGASRDPAWVRIVSDIGVRLRASALFDSFESLGDNCEFGLVQAAYRSTHVGLVRSASTTIDGLVAMLDERFASLRSAGSGDFRVDVRRGRPDARDENIVVLERFGVEYHGGMLDKNPDPEVYRLKQVRRLALLSRKMIEQIEGDEKIFVFKSLRGASEADVYRLAKAMHRIGPATLLWITPASEGGTPGRVEKMADGLLHGCIDRLAPYSDAGDFSLQFWKPVCRNAYRLWRGAR